MSADNLAIQQRVLAAFATGDEATINLLVHPDFILEGPKSLPYGGTYHGPAGFLAFRAKFLETLDIEALTSGENFVSASGSIVGEIFLSVKLKSTGQHLSSSILEKWQFSDGKATRLTAHYFTPFFH